MKKKYLFDEYSVLYKIKSIHANDIYNLNKKFEFRKIIPTKKPKVIFLYEHEKKKAITGAFIVQDIITLPVKNLARKANLSGKKLASLKNYFESYEMGNAFEIGEVFKFEIPLTKNQISDLENKYRPPQSFIYLKNYKKLQDELFSILDRQYRKSLDQISLNDPKEEDFKSFKKLALREISKNYDEIDESFVSHIIECTKNKIDIHGYFTKHKNLYVIKNGEVEIGYTVITEKIGLSIKTGPTILFKNFQKKGFGQLIRKKIEYEYYNRGFRKIYCTCNAFDKEVLNYLLKSGMRVEAHLINQYKNNSSEVVLGKLLVKEKKYFPKIRRISNDIVNIKKITGSFPIALESYLKNNFGKYYCEIDDDFLNNLALSTKKFSLTNYSGKGKRVYMLLDIHSKIVGCVISSLKRGGAVKLTLIITTKNYLSIKKSLTKIEDYFKSYYRKKVYLNLPVNDSLMIGYFSKIGYQIEGLLQAPYLAGLDLVQMGKLI